MSERVYFWVEYSSYPVAGGTPLEKVKDFLLILGLFKNNFSEENQDATNKG